MTTKITVEAHCSPDKYVSVRITEPGLMLHYPLKNGESIEKYVYDERSVTVQELFIED